MNLGQLSNLSGLVLDKSHRGQKIGFSVRVRRSLLGNSCYPSKQADEIRLGRQIALFNWFLVRKKKETENFYQFKIKIFCHKTRKNHGKKQKAEQQNF